MVRRRPGVERLFAALANLIGDAHQRWVIGGSPEPFGVLVPVVQG